MMALMKSAKLSFQLVSLKASCSAVCKGRRHASVVAGVAVEPVQSPVARPLPLSGGVVVSTCRDVFANLAFEDWIYQNGNVPGDSRLNMMFLWRNDPCVVIGRHQNVWVECNVHEALSSNIAVARRRSGGGTVYHDGGNLNITFFTDRKSYDRKQNLTMIADALKQQCSLNVAVSQRDDIMLNEVYKVRDFRIVACEKKY
jgi:lipoate-protein ligase A